MKKKELMYNGLSSCYDLIYSWKDYEKEANEVRSFIEKYKRSKGNKLLELGCGTGKHIKYLSKYYDCLGTDLNDGVLEKAKHNVKDVEFFKANMIDFDLGEQFDVIVSMFGAIGYVKTKQNLEKTIKQIAKHLKRGGIMFIEGWYSSDEFKERNMLQHSYEDDDMKISRITHSMKRGDVSVLEFHWLIGSMNEGIRYFKDVHELGLFERNYVESLMKKHNMEVVSVGSDLFRNLYVGVKM